MRFSSTAAVQAAHQAQVAAGAHVGVEGRHLDEAADVLEGLDLVARHLVVDHHGVAAGRVDQADDHADRRGLAGAVGPEKAEHVAAAHREVEAVDGQGVAEPLGQVVGGQHDWPGIPLRPLPCRHDILDEGLSDLIVRGVRRPRHLETRS